MKVEARCDRSDPAFFSNLYADSLLTYYLAMAQRDALGRRMRILAHAAQMLDWPDWPDAPKPKWAVLR